MPPVTLHLLDERGAIAGAAAEVWREEVVTAAQQVLEKRSKRPSLRSLWSSVRPHDGVPVGDVRRVTGPARALVQPDLRVGGDVVDVSVQELVVLLVGRVIHPVSVLRQPGVEVAPPWRLAQVRRGAAVGRKQIQLDVFVAIVIKADQDVASGRIERETRRRLVLVAERIRIRVGQVHAPHVVLPVQVR